jgi:type II secretory pathway predicted ATPase ExeA
VWQQHWGLARDPFDELDSPYVPLPSHDEASFRLVYSIERGRRDVVFSATAGLGKTVVLRRALAESRSPRRRVILIEASSDGGQILGRLAARLGQQVRREVSLPSKWETLERAFRIAALEGLHIILALDNSTQESETRVLGDLHALAHTGSGDRARLTIVRVGCPPWDGGLESLDTSTLAISLKRLTRSQVEEYLTVKLAAAGCTERIFTPRAVTRLHGLSRGVPRGLEQLAALSLMAGAVRGLEVIPPDIVDGVAQECGPDESKVMPWL